ncbi:MULTISPECIES: hypothetical protein [unclassified Duganella]|uniref:hypothetical protein n=1 Tax=unclassified Duganella TaxID=2636909 RepID=UPI000E355D23|nr:MULTISPECIES: hypothetical protein [unclassified Duganella]RFP14792.1 hypothetical protein D0T23_12385 [Duganella sp. BJB475]RFP31141.1 hypothetical protein D0T21_14765 [Duganella sp. BJB476]
MKNHIKSAAGLLLVAVAAASPAFAAPDITVRTIPFNAYAQDALATISADGRYVAYKFEQRGPGSYARYIYIQDMVTNQRIPANVTLKGAVGGACDYPSMSANGRYVAFGCAAATMGAVTKSGAGYFVYDRVTNTTQMIPDTGDDRPATGYATGISADGRYVAFRTNTASGVSKIFVRDMVNKTTSGTNAQFVNAGGNSRLSISADGRYIAYLGRAGFAGNPNVSVYDRRTGVTEAVDVLPDGSRSTANPTEPTISEDGSAVVFTSPDTALATQATPKGLYAAFVRDRKTGKTEQISGVINAHVTSSAISGNGRYVGYILGGSMYVHDRLTKIARKIVLSALTAYGPPRFSSDGRYVVFTTSNPAGNMQSVTIADLGVAANVTLSATTLSLTEGGIAGTYSMALTQAPEFDVKVALGTSTQLNLARSELTFTPDNWTQPQVVSVQAVADGVAEGPHSAAIVHTVTSADVNYNVVKPADVTVTINDGITPTIVLPGITWNGTELPLTGTAAPGATVLLTAVNRSTGWLSSVSTVADAQGQWRYMLTNYTEGVIDLDAQADGIKSVVRTITIAFLPPPPISLPPAQQ